MQLLFTTQNIYMPILVEFKRDNYNNFAITPSGLSHKGINSVLTYMI